MKKNNLIKEIIEKGLNLEKTLKEIQKTCLENQINFDEVSDCDLRKDEESCRLWLLNYEEGKYIYYNDKAFTIRKHEEKPINILNSIFNNKLFKKHFQKARKPIEGYQVIECKNNKPKELELLKEQTESNGRGCFFLAWDGWRFVCFNIVDGRTTACDFFDWSNPPTITGGWNLKNTNDARVHALGVFCISWDLKAAEKIGDHLKLRKNREPEDSRNTEKLAHGALNKLIDLIIIIKRLLPVYNLKLLDEFEDYTVKDGKILVDYSWRADHGYYMADGVAE